MDPVVFMAFAVAVVFGLPLVRAAARRMEKGEVQPRHLAAIEERLAKIEQAVDTIAFEVERVAEGQRFTAKLLADRHGAPKAE